MPTKKDRLITQAEYARRRKISRANVCKLVARGVIKAVGKKKLVDPVQADKARRDNTSPGQIAGGNAKLPGKSRGKKPTAKKKGKSGNRNRGSG